MPKIQRPCLRCRTLFWSVDRITNQICERCKQINSRLSLREGKRGAKITSDLSLVDPGVTKVPNVKYDK